jgi:hypothetical protein
MIDERVFAWTLARVTVDGTELETPEPYTWGCRSPTMDEILAGTWPAPEPGVRVLAEILAPVLFTADELTQHLDRLHAYLGRLTPPNVLPAISIRGNELRQASGIAMEPEVPEVQPLTQPDTPK